MNLKKNVIMHINELKDLGKCNTKGKGVEISSREIKLLFSFFPAFDRNPTL